MKPKLVAPFLLTLFLLTACSASERHERTIWYVAPAGNDAAVCTELTDPCRTLAEVLGRADADDKIILAAGTYVEVETDESYPAILSSLRITGAGMDETIIDMGSTDGLRIIGWGTYQLENFKIQNSRSNCIAITYRSRSDSVMTAPPGFIASIENVEASDCTGSGFFFAGDHGTGTGDDVEVTLINVVANSNGFNGVAAAGAEVTIQGGEFSENVEGGLYAAGGAAVIAADNLITANRRGAILLDSSRLLLEVSTISNSPNEAVFVAGELAQAELQNVTITNNCTSAEGIGQACTIYNIDGTIAIRNSWITNNLAGAILNNGGQVSIEQTTIDDNTGSVGTIHNENGAMVIQNSLIANNTAPFAIRNDTELSISNSTISGNSEIGVIAERDELSLSFVTIAENGDAGLAVQGDGSIRRATNVLIVKNRLDCVGTNLVPALRIGGTNFDSDGSCPEPFITRSPANILLDVLADNGGLTLTHALLPGSPAIDAAIGLCIEVDQRLIPRPAGAACDVGAYEASAVFTDGTDSTPTPPAEITAIVLDDARCRTGPGQVYADFDFFEPQQSIVVTGRSADSNWYFVEAISYAGNCWIGNAVLQFDVSAEVLLALPIINPPPTPTPTLDPDESYDATDTPEPTACPTLINKPGSCK